MFGCMFSLLSGLSFFQELTDFKILGGGEAVPSVMLKLSY